MLNIIAVPAFDDNYIWLIQAKNSRQILIVDPGDADPVLTAITKHSLIPSAILITHYHYDHIGGVDNLIKQYPIPVYGSSREPGITVSHPLIGEKNLFINTAFPALTVLDLPGHTTNHIAFLIEDCLFCGDTLFGAGCGRLLGGTAEQLFQSLGQIASLKKHTKIYCAHEYTESNLLFAVAVEPNNKAIRQRIDATFALRQKNMSSVPSTLALELATNPFLRCHQHDVIQSAQQFMGKPLTSPVEVFTALRLWKDQF